MVDETCSRFGSTCNLLCIDVYLFFEILWVTHCELIHCAELILPYWTSHLHSVYLSIVFCCYKFASCIKYSLPKSFYFCLMMPSSNTHLWFSALCSKRILLAAVQHTLQLCCKLNYFLCCWCFIAIVGYSPHSTYYTTCLGLHLLPALKLDLWVIAGLECGMEQWMS